MGRNNISIPDSFSGEVSKVSLRWSAISDPGKVRTTNEDGALTAPGIYLLADGMGGHEGGEIASAAALAAMSGLELCDYRVLLEKFSEALIKASHDIDHIESKTGRQAGTTLTGAILTLVNGAVHWLILNIGDSRTYRFIGGSLYQLTTDHSQVQELIDSGFLSAEAARTDARRNVITRALGAGMIPECEYWLYPLVPGERLLICSDGLTGEIEDFTIVEILSRHDKPADAVSTLVTSALEAGAHDNVTLIVVDVENVAADMIYKPKDSDDDAVIHGDLTFINTDHGLVPAYEG